MGEKYQFKRARSEFWVIIHKNLFDYNITTSNKYIKIINKVFPILERNSPIGWKISPKKNYMSSIWLPNGKYEQSTITELFKWCEVAVENLLWLGLNKNIKQYFNAELDYCIALDFNYANFSYKEGRTEIGEAEYQLKYNAGNLNEEELKKYADILMNKMIGVYKECIQVGTTLEWSVSPMPATEQGKTKMAWLMAEELAMQLQLPFIEPLVVCDKPQMKELTIQNKIETWEKIYYNNGVEIADTDKIRGKNIIVVDDLYQSGATMWEYAKFLKLLGARCVFGVVCVKSLKDSDNQ